MIQYFELDISRKEAICGSIKLVTVYVSVNGLLSICWMLIQELEIQARAHGLAIVSSTLCSSELAARHVKQEQVLGNCTQDMYPLAHPSCPDMGRSSTLDLNDGTITFSDSSTSTDAYGLVPKAHGAKLDDILMDDTLSSVATSDPLTSISSGASNESSCKDSVNMEEIEHVC